MPYPMKSKPPKRATIHIDKPLFKEVLLAAELEGRTIKTYIERAIERALTVSATTTAR